MKKVIIIAGAARSGSTLLSLMLGNDPKGLSVGELINVMRPNSTDELLKDRKCFCTDSECDFWQRMLRAGEKHIYSKIFEEKSHLNFIVDSSKRHLWLKDQMRYSKNKNYEIIPLIIYKSPVEYAYSKAKRDNLGGWKNGWIKEYRKLFDLLDNFMTVKYQELAKNPSAKLKTLCEQIGIPYFKDKKHFWNGNNAHSLFGSNSVKVANKLIYYDEQYDKSKLERLKTTLDLNDNLLNEVLEILNAFEVDRNDDISKAMYSLKDEVGTHSFLSDLVYRLQATPYYTINKPMSALTKSLIKMIK